MKLVQPLIYDFIVFVIFSMFLKVFIHFRLPFVIIWNKRNLQIGEIIW